MDNFLMHYGRSKRAGAPVGSGRYPLGSGDNPYQHDGSFYSRIYEYKKTINPETGKLFTEKEIAENEGMKTTELRARYSLSKDAFKAEQISNAIRYKDKGMSNVAIGEKMGIPESTVRNLLNPTLQERTNKTREIADILKKEVEKKKYLDIGPGVEYQLGVSNTKLKTAVAMLKDEGYKTQFLAIEQATNPGKKTTITVLTKDDVPWKTVHQNRDQIKSVLDVYSEDGGRTWRNIKPPKSVDVNRIQVRYAEDGGDKKDGLIELRPGTEDLYMGNNKYSQVRIAVNGTHYLKGMAVFNDDMPKGVDIIFNTKKTKDVPVLGDKDNSILKPLKDDKNNPFESTIKQINYIDKNGKEHLSPINIVNDDEEWGKWAKTLSSQMLSKQRPDLAKQQLDISYRNKKLEFEEIQSLTNPAIKKRLLISFADDCDSSAVHLKAAALPRQSSHVLLPINSLKDNEIFAPNYRNGEEVILIRHPHEGTFQIPRLIVNNKNKEAASIIGLDSRFAVGINHKVAQQMSGADFDGDTAIIIPTINKNLRTSRPIKALMDFDPSEAYKSYPGMPEVSPKTGFQKQMEMGKISNLITDMTIKGAKEEEIVRAVKHSMTIIDAEKHNLNWRQSFKDNGIAELKERYQGGKNKGASTLISKAKSKYMVDERTNKYGERGAYDIDPKTGEKLYSYTGAMRKTKTGKEVKKLMESTKMYETPDARKLSTGTRIEEVYADYANKMKALGNEARKEYISVKPQKYSPTAKIKYQEEVDRLNAALNVAKKHAPQERRAQLITDKTVETIIKANPDLYDDYSSKKKLKAQVLEEARARTGGKKSRIEISPKEWEAIQAGAISNTKLEDILRNTNLDHVKELATPRTRKGISASQISRAKNLLNLGYTWKEIADQVGVSVSTLQKEIGSKN